VAGTNNNQGSTRQRLLETAGEMFAEHGYDNATVREICRRAGSNVAAVNYHFGDKEGLYAAVLEFADETAEQVAPLATELAGELTPEQRLHAFVRSLLLRMLGQGPKAWHVKLMAREMVDPTSALERVIERSYRPHFERLQAIVRDLVEGEMDAATLRLTVMCVVGQCVHFYHARPVISRLQPELKYRPEDIEMLAAHVTRFSLAALKHLSVGKERAT
jgi:AcrR family transcriptional regulator